MIIFDVMLILLVLLIIHLIILPLSKRRPILIKGFEGAFLFLVGFTILAFFIHPILYVIAIAIGLLIYYTGLWIVYGVAIENINNAFTKAVLATRVVNIKVRNGYEIDNTMQVKIINIGIRLCFIHYKSNTYSKKSELTKEVFRKFIQNYYI